MLLLLTSGEPTPPGGRQNIDSRLSYPFLRGPGRLCLDRVGHGVLLAAQADVKLDPLCLGLVANYLIVILGNFILLGFEEFGGTVSHADAHLGAVRPEEVFCRGR